MFKVLIFLIFLFVISSAKDEQPPCRWLGTAPFCGSHTCAEGEVWRLINTKDNGIAKVFPFGHTCLMGNKTLCCKKGYEGAI